VFCCAHAQEVYTFSPNYLSYGTGQCPFARVIFDYELFVIYSRLVAVFISTCSLRNHLRMLVDDGPIAI
jgi:hypothetical protein